MVSKLKDSGFEVISREDVAASESITKIKNKKDKVKKGYSRYAPTGLSSGSTFTMQMNTPMFMGEFKADALNISLTLDPMARQRDQTKFVTKKTKVGQSVHVSQLDANISTMKNSKCHKGKCYGPATGSIKFINPIYSEIAFAHVEDDTNTKANVAGHVVTGLLRLGGARAKTNYTFKYILNAEEEKYLQAAKDALSKTNEKLVSELNNLY